MLEMNIHHTLSIDFYICFCFDEDTITIVDVTDKDNMNVISRASPVAYMYIQQVSRVEYTYTLKSHINKALISFFNPSLAFCRFVVILFIFEGVGTDVLGDRQHINMMYMI